MSIKNKKIFLIILFLLLLKLTSLLTPLYAAFLDMGWGVRPSSMGGAFTSVADDANAPLWNPAGICQIKTHQVTLMYAKPYWGLENVDLGYNYFSYLLPYSPDTAFGISWTNFNSKHQYSEDTLNLSIAQKLYLSTFSSSSNEDIEVMTGVNLRRLSHKYILDEDTEDDPVFSKRNSKSATDLDVGVLARYPNGLSMGFFVEHLLRPNVGMQEADHVPMDMHAGVSMLLLDKILTALEVSLRDGIYNYHLGLEGDVLVEKMVLRSGVNLREVAVGFGYIHKAEKGFKVSIDYAFIFPFKMEEKRGTHRISLNMGFGKPITSGISKRRDRFRL